MVRSGEERLLCDPRCELQQREGEREEVRELEEKCKNKIRHRKKRKKRREGRGRCDFFPSHPI